jgi:PAS domain S-box-containing protein
MVEGPRVSSFVQSSPYSVWLATTDGRCTYANPALERLIGLGSGQIIDVDWRSFFLEEDRVPVATSRQRSLVTGSPCRT